MNALTRIYEASEAARELEFLIESTRDTGGDITELESQIDALATKADSLPAAFDDLMGLVRDIEARAEARKAEAKRLADRAKRDEATAAWFKSQILRVMMGAGAKTMETPRFRLTVAQPGGKPALEIVAEVPDQFTEVVTEVVPNKDAIRAALDRGETLPFAHYVPKQPYLRVS